MQNEEQRLIEGLFQRLKQAEQQSGTRDGQADRLIAEFVRQQPSAPYYMAQSMLIQEAALKRLHAQIQDLQNEVASLKNSQQSGNGSFLSSLFGGGKSQPQQPANNWNSAPQQQPPQQQAAPTYAQPAPRSGGFMAGALQTAAGVAGGVVLADMLTSMFHRSQPQEIVNIIEQPIEQVSDVTGGQNFSNDFQDQDSFTNASDRSFFDQSNDDNSRFLDQDDDYDFGGNNDDDSFI
ncbi:MAG: DUF2076 domain-containing protein [Enterobacteriaceae bacterium]|uniref:ABC transporter substrate-binding protein n=1 Tax=Kluyvera intermedia TaxID=61648 RepID=A0ABX3UI27_KLUIN|nr:DUF2076 domain-containing protein [Kluyvera intermedia]MDU6683642.1 DUF2076 domain-containing protein [Enterobacteriaceae bacterium]ORJ51125.1 ABC transporter substrate-binding protein [Kluyvera intermedia]